MFWLIILVSFTTAFVVSFSMMKFHMRMIEKWMDEFFDEQFKYIKNIYKDSQANRTKR